MSGVFFLTFDITKLLINQLEDEVRIHLISIRPFKIFLGRIFLIPLGLRFFFVFYNILIQTDHLVSVSCDIQLFHL